MLGTPVVSPQCVTHQPDPVFFKDATEILIQDNQIASFITALTQEQRRLGSPVVSTFKGYHIRHDGSLSSSELIGQLLRYSIENPINK